MHKKLASAAAFAVLLAACGGSDSSAPVNPPVDPKVVALTEITSVLQQVTTSLASVDTVIDAEEFFDPQFLHGGLTLEQLLADTLDTSDDETSPTYLNATWRDAEVVDLTNNGNKAKVRFTVEYGNRFAPAIRTMNFTKVDGKWLVSGNQELAEVSVSGFYELQDKPMATADVLALPGLTSRLGSWEGTEYTYYEQALPVDGQSEFPGVVAWVGREGDTFENFGRMIWTGQEFDAGWTSFDDRLLRKKYTKTISTPNALVLGNVWLNVDAKYSDADIKSSLVKGPGLPAAGVTLVRTGSGFALKGATLAPAVYSTAICQRLAPENRPGNCELDWSLLKAGATYTFEFYDQDQVKLGETEYALPGDLLSAEAVLANKNEYFATLATSPAGTGATTPELSVANIFNDVDGPFLPGKTIPLYFNAPTGNDSVLTRFVSTIETCQPDLANCDATQGTLVVNTMDVQLYNTAFSAVVGNPGHTVPADWNKLKWMAVDTFAQDKVNNVYVQHSSPKNHK